MKKLKFTALCALFLSLIMVLGMVPTPVADAANPELKVNLASSKGSLRYGATGFLYGMSHDGIPTDTMISALKPQVTVQKAPNGLQHPGGDALEISDAFIRNGGKSVQIYMQDYYVGFPYPYNIANYRDVLVPQIMSQVMAHPHRDKFVYVPFNEPDWVWYSAGNSTSRQQFYSDYKQIHDKIKSIDPNARIVGPNPSTYNTTLISGFFTYCKQNNCLPELTSWHELGNDFFTSWYSHYDNYRALETSLGIAPREIIINEFLKTALDLGVPGTLMQYISRFENSKVDGANAYWTPAGSLNDLVTQNNKATAGWWLFKWYGEMTGNQVTVTPPNANVNGLQGVASLDSSKKQARVILGGASGANDVVVEGMGSASYLGNSVHATVWAINEMGRQSRPEYTNQIYWEKIPSAGPVFKQEGTYTVSNGSIRIPITGMTTTSAYLVIITPEKSLSAASNNNKYEAEYASLSGSANVTYSTGTGYSGTYFVEGYGSSTNASTNFLVTAANDGYYNVNLRYAAGAATGATTDRTIRLALNGTNVGDITLTGTANWNTWATKTTTMYLTAGINRIAVNAYTSNDNDAINIDYVEILPSSGTTSSYEAETQTRSGTVVVSSNAAASGGQYADNIGNGNNNYLQFNNVNVPTAGTYKMVVQYANYEVDLATSNNPHDMVDRSANISINGGTAKEYYFRNTYSWTNFRTNVINVQLNAGNNTIRFSNSSAYAPNIDKIVIAAPIGVEAPPTSGFDPSKYYRIKNRTNSKVADSGGQTTDGSNVKMWTDGTSNNLQWQILDQSNGYYKIKNRTTGKFLDSSGQTTDGSILKMTSDSTSNNLQWQIIDLGTGYYKIKNRATSKVLDSAGTTTDGDNVKMWTDGSSNNLQWQIIQN